MNETPNWALTKQEKDVKGAAHYIDELFRKRKPEFEAALKGAMTPEFFRRLVMTAFNGNERLLNCSQASIYQSALEIAALQLEPNTALDEAHLIPYGNKCTVQIGRNGYIKLAFRTGLVSDVNALPIYRGEEFTWQPGAKQEIVHSPDIEIAADAELIAAYAWVDMKDGRRVYEVLRKFEWEKIRDDVLRKGKSPGWAKYPDRMACRSALKRLIRTRLPVNENMVETINTRPAPDLYEELIVDEPRSGMTIDIGTGEVIEVPQATEPSEPDGVSEEPTRGDITNSTKLTAAQFWKELGIACKFWKVRYSKDEVKGLSKRMWLQPIVGNLTVSQRQKLLSAIEDELRTKSAVEEPVKEENDDDISY